MNQIHQQFANLCYNYNNLNDISNYYKINFAILMTYENNYEKFYNKLFYDVCIQGKHQIAKFIWNSFNEIIICNQIDENDFSLLIKKKILKISSYNEKLFIDVCKNNHLDIAKWLLEIEPKINISFWNESVFRFACANCKTHINIAKWLLEIPNKTIKISVLQDEAFRNIIKANDLEFAKWLYTKYPTINVFANNDEVIKTANKIGNQEMINWLSNLKLNYKPPIKNKRK